jgi:lipid A disaccharide synthetase
MVLIYKFVLPSVWTFRQKQMFGYESKLLDEIEKLRKDIEKMKEGK